jgi:hypothetical protein
VVIHLLTLAACLGLTNGCASLVPDQNRPSGSHSVQASALDSLVFNGEATNHGYPTFPTGPITAAVTLTVGDEYVAKGHLLIEPPLGGSGNITLYRWADSVFFISVSPGGDTIAWLGALADRRIQGEYRVVGGQASGQWGDWQMSQVGGASLRSLPAPSRPFPDSVDFSTLAMPATSPELWVPRELRGTSASQPGTVASDSGLVWLHPDSSSFTLSMGRFGPCNRSFDTGTRVALLSCPSAGSPDGREYIEIGFLLPRVWAERVSTEMAANSMLDTEFPGAITEHAFQARAQLSDSINTYYLVQTHVAPAENTGSVYISMIAPLGEAVSVLSYGYRFDYPHSSLRRIQRAWLLGNLPTHSRQLGRLRIDPAWANVMAALAQ